MKKAMMVAVVMMITYSWCVAMNEEHKDQEKELLVDTQEQNRGSLFVKKGRQLYYQDKLVAFENDTVRLKNGTYGNIQKVLALRNILREKMLNKSHEAALKLLNIFCKSRVVYGLAKVQARNGDFYIFLTDDEHQAAIKKDIENINTLLDLGLVKKSKTFSAYVIPEIVHNVGQSSITVTSSNITIDEPVDIFNTCKDIFGDEWQQELLGLMKK